MTRGSGVDKSCRHVLDDAHDAARVMVVDFEETFESVRDARSKVSLLFESPEFEREKLEGIDPELERRGSRAKGRMPSNLAVEGDSKDVLQDEARKKFPLLFENAELDRENFEALEDRANRSESVACSVCIISLASRYLAGSAPHECI